LNELILTELLTGHLNLATKLKQDEDRNIKNEGMDSEKAWYIFGNVIKKLF